MPALTQYLAGRATNASEGSYSPISIVGFSLAGLVIITMVVLLLYRLFSKRKSREWGTRTVSEAVVSIEVDEKVSYSELYHDSKANVSPSSFSRANLTHAIVLPSKALTRSSPATVAHRPFGFALDAARRISRVSSVFSSRSSAADTEQGRLSVLSATSDAPRGEAGGAERRMVRQAFAAPVLPDELLATRVGETLTLVREFDDGWCMVGRRNPGYVPQQRSLFGGGGGVGAAAAAAGGGGEGEDAVELGVVPKWCFDKPVKGAVPVRPVRVSSLGMTKQFQGTGVMEEREDVKSWSYF